MRNSEMINELVEIIKGLSKIQDLPDLERDMCLDIVSRFVNDVADKKSFATMVTFPDDLLNSVYTPVDACAKSTLLVFDADEDDTTSIDDDDKEELHEPSISDAIKVDSLFESCCDIDKFAEGCDFDCEECHAMHDDKDSDCGDCKECEDRSANIDTPYLIYTAFDMVFERLGKLETFCGQLTETLAEDKKFKKKFDDHVKEKKKIKAVKSKKD